MNDPLAPTNRCIVLAARPRGLPRPADFRTIEAPIPTPAHGQVLIRHTWLGLAPAARLRMSETPSFREPMALGEVVFGQAVGEVVASRDPSLREGDAVMSIAGGWQRYSVAAAGTLVRIDVRAAPAPVWLGALGTSGLTAYVGLSDIGRARAGEMVVVSASAGAVGSIAGQLAKRLGCRVVGIAGGPLKARHVVETLGFDAGLDHRADDLESAVRAACPSGVDVYFDNVGGAVRDAVWPSMAPDGRVVVCGQIADYNGGGAGGPGWMAILGKRLTVRGFTLADHLHRRGDFERDMLAGYRDGSIRVVEDVHDGLESAIPAFIAMLTGGTLGKTLVRL